MPVRDAGAGAMPDVRLESLPNPLGTYGLQCPHREIGCPVRAAA